MPRYHLGLNLGHDRAAALVRDGEVVVAIHQERLDRLKHSVGFLHQAVGDPSQIQLPHESIHYCLEACGIGLSDVATVSANMPGIDHAADILRRSLPPEFADRVRVPPGHHLMHAYSAYWPSGFDDAVVFVVDASGSSRERQTESYTLYEANGTKLDVLHEERVPSHLAALSTLGFLYEYVSRKAGFSTRVGDAVSVPEAGKLMGLAPYGGKQANWQPWIRSRTDGYSLDISAYDVFLEVAALEKKYDDGVGQAYLRPYLVDLAWKIQHELERGLLHVAGLALKRTGKRKLCLAGGVALNSVANYKMLCELDLDDIFVFPAAGDAGIAAGCALWAYAEHEGGNKRPVMKRATLGRSYGEASIQAAVDKFAEQIAVEWLDPASVVEQTAQALAKGHVVARFEGGSEFGPRALGHRSILADPGFARMKDILNARVKFREAFRPFAPVIPEEDIEQVFEQKVPSPFMLVVSQIRPEFHQQIPAVTHYDGSGRVQTVTSADNPFMHKLCGALATARKGPPVVLNTSFNVAGQPIVETPEEAIATFLATDIDYLFLENLRIAKRHVPVLDYEHHLAKVGDGALPHGLPGGQPSLLDLMRQLDRALFSGETEGCPWSEAELRELSAKGARYKETSRLFGENPYGVPLRSQLSARTVLLLDPQNGSQLLDTEGIVPAVRLNQAEVRLLLCMIDGEPACLERLRTEQQATTLEWRERIDAMAERMRGYGLELATTEWALGEDHPLPGQAGSTLAPFADERYRLPQTAAALRAVLRGAGYEEAAICALLKLESLQLIEPTRLHYYDRFLLPETALADLVRLFLLRASLPEVRVRALFGQALFDAMARLGLLLPRGDRWASRVDIFSVEGLYLATDHRYMLDREGDRLDEDPVMYIGLDSRGLVHSAPRKACGKLLDLCTGSGVQALSGSRYAREAVGVDLNPRAVRFARFNAQLNGIDNARFVLGDLYAPVKGAGFDIVLANPPFVPSPHGDLGFRDGGRTGEGVLQRIVNEAAAHLNPDGALAIVTDLVELPAYQAKLEGWWQGGAAHMLVLHTADRDEILFSVPHSHAPFGQSYQAYNEELDKWLRNYRDAGLKAVNFGYIFIRRLPGAHAGSYYSRVVHNPATPIHQEVAQYFRQRQRLSEGVSRKAYLRLMPGLRIRFEIDIGGTERQIELSVPGNPYFTTYRIDADLYRELQFIAERRPALEVYAESGNWPRIVDLVLKGVLELAGPAQAGQACQDIQGLAVPGLAAKAAEPEAKPNGANAPSLGIRELETKTTPTCLSSYLA